MQRAFVLTLVGAGAALLSGSARAAEIARWDFDDQPAGEVFSTDRVGQLRANGYNNPAKITRTEGVNGGGALRLENAGLSDRDGAVLLVQDAPRLTNREDGQPLNSLTIEVDVKLDALADQAQIVRKTDGDVGYELYVNKAGNVAFRVKGTEGTLIVTSRNTIAPDGKWHHVAATWQGDMKIYSSQIRLDDVAVTRTQKVGTLVDTSAPLVIGGLYRGEKNLGQRLSGAIDNLVISYDRRELMAESGKIDPTPIQPTGAHLMSQPGMLSAGFIADPPPTPECHAGSIAQTPDGKLLAVWFGGTYEGHIDVGAWSSLFDGATWTAPREVANGVQPDGTRHPVFNPVVYQYPDGPTLLFYMAGPADAHWPGHLKTSTDGGLTWSEGRRLPDGIRGGTKNQPVLLDDGTLVCPDNSNQLKFDRTRDYGQTWLPSGVADPNGIPAIQPAILKHRDGRLQALARSQKGSIVQTWSSDGGATWSPVEKTSLPNNHSGIGATTLKDGRFLLVYNHSAVPEGKWGGPRTPLNVAVSEDGINWQAAAVLEDEPGEYSYPSVIQASDGTVHVIYTWHRVRMKHAALDPSKFVLRPIVDGQWPGSGGKADAGKPDAGKPDAGKPDAGKPDAGKPDAGKLDGGKQ